MSLILPRRGDRGSGKRAVEARGANAGDAAAGADEFDPSVGETDRPPVPAPLRNLVWARAKTGEEHDRAVFSGDRAAERSPAFAIALFADAARFGGNSNLVVGEARGIAALLIGARRQGGSLVSALIGGNLQPDIDGPRRGAVPRAASLQRHLSSEGSIYIAADLGCRLKLHRRRGGIEDDGKGARLRKVGSRIEGGPDHARPQDEDGHRRAAASSENDEMATREAHPRLNA